MRKPQSNGLVEIHGQKTAPERGFVCMKLILFLTEDGVRDWEQWLGAHLQAASGQCPYTGRCPIYARTAKNRPIQLSLF